MSTVDEQRLPDASETSTTAGPSRQRRAPALAGVPAAYVISTMYTVHCPVMLATMTGTDRRADATSVNWGELGVGELPTGTVTLLLADVEASTTLWEAEPEAMMVAVANLDRTLTDLLAVYGGVRPVEQGEGDSFVVAFARATEAVACALALQRAPLSSIRLRIGVHTGEVQLRDASNYVGPTINRTARLRDLGHGGQTLLSGITEDLVIDALPDGAWLVEHGRHELRGAVRPERVVQLCHPDVRNDFPRLRTTNSSSAEHLPVQLTSFIGRKAEIAEVRRVLGANRLVTLTGAGGVGKTRLAIQIAGQLADEFDSGSWYVDLAPITDPNLVPVAMAGALGHTEQRRSTTDTLIWAVGDHPMLVVLDNCEHLLGSVAALASSLLRACPRLTLLATSREPVGIAGETTWQVPSLPLDGDAIELFIDRARRVRADFTLGDDADTVREICRRLDGIPLAIELAAARLRALSLEEIVGSLHDRFRLLTGGGRTAVRRQQTLHASVDWSHALLTEPERVLFRRLAAFAGGFDLAAARLVAGSADVERYQILDQLTLLVDKSLVIADEAGGRIRYRMLETMRQYASEKLGESGEADTVRARHRDHYTTIAALLDAPANIAYQQRVEQAEAEIDNLRTAFIWSRENRDIELALQLAASLQPLWLTRGRLREGLSWLDGALADVDASGLEVAPAALARALASAALLDSWVGVTQRREQANRALEIARKLNDPALLVRALAACCGTAAFDPEHASGYFAEGVELARGLGDKWRLSQLLAFQTYTAMMAGDAEAARMAGEEGREVAEAIGDRFSAGVCRVWGVGGALAVLGDLRGGTTELTEVIADATAAGDLLCRFNGLQSLSFVLGWHGKPSEALVAAQAAIESGAELGESMEALGYLCMSAAHLAAGDVAEAGDASARGWSHITDTEFSKMNMRWLAETHYAAGDLAAARLWADRAVSATSGYFQMMSLLTHARIAQAEQDMEAAESDTYKALEYVATTTVQLAVPEIFELLAGLEALAQSHVAAVRLVGAAEGIRQRTGEVRYVVYQPGYEALVNTLRDALGENDFEVVKAEGATLSTAGAIAYALRGRGERKRPSTGWASLTPAELDIVRLVSAGMSNKDIAARLFIARRTVETHLTHVYAKLGLRSRVQLAQEAVRHTDVGT